MPEKPVILWFRRDLRLRDHTAFAQAIASGAPIVPLFIFDPALRHGPRYSVSRMAFLLEALQSLDADLRQHHSALVIRHGSPLDELPHFAATIGASAVYASRDYSPYAEKRDHKLQEALNVPLHLADDAVLMPPGSVTKDDGEPYMVYTPFWKKWRGMSKPDLQASDPAQARFASLDGIDNPGLPTRADLHLHDVIELPPASEHAAHERLRAFTKRHIYAYETARNALTQQPFSDPRPPGPSYLSPYLRLGMLSPRQAYWAAREAHEAAERQTARDAVTAWVSELAWREFYMHILHFFPHVDRQNFRREYDDLAWRHDPEGLQAWQDGLTGYPIVDAAMRQLQQIGWMPNRARMIVASFLTKDLLIDWREGERHFMNHLLDGDPAANNGGWQWAAGTGTDAQPYFRIFNPASQSKKFDPQGDYIRYWVPELRELDAKHIHTPQDAPKPPADYPPPIVDHKLARQRTLDAFKAVKDQA